MLNSMQRKALKKLGEKKVTRVQTRVDERLDIQLRAFAHRHGLTRGTAIRALLILGLKDAALLAPETMLTLLFEAVIRRIARVDTPRVS